jgi:DNA repair exonuclease SbcCD ATPase subunit
MITNTVGLVITNFDAVAISNQIATAISQLPQQMTNWTTVWQTFFGIIAIAFPTAIAVIKIFSSKQNIKDELLRESLYLQEIKKYGEHIADNFDIYKKENNSSLQTLREQNNTSLQTLREQFTAIRIEFTEISTQHANNTRTIEEIKKDYRDLIRRLDELLKQFSDYIGSESY